jgi:hypothetical protein
MTVKSNINGTYTVKTKADAIKALKMMQERSEEAQALMKEHGINELMQEAAELKKAATAYCVAKRITKLDMDDSYAQLREDGYDRRWIATSSELASLDNPAGATPLRVILINKWKSQPDTFKVVWRRITKRVVDADALQEAVDEGIVTEDEIAPAFVEKHKSPYLRVYPKS